jgi:hypothetical protein
LVSKNLRWIIPALMGLALTSCVATKIRSWRADEFAMVQESWRYYRWDDPALQRLGTEQQLETADAMVEFDAALRRHVNDRLRALGYRVRATDAQFVVAYRVGSEEVVGLPGPADTSARDAAERIFAGPNAEYEVSSKFYTHHTLGYHEISHLKLSFYDTRQKRIVWEGTASRLVEDPNASPAKIDREVGQAVNGLLADFPPAARRH